MRLGDGNLRCAVACSRRRRATCRRDLHGRRDLEIIPAPGHTDGATVYLWDTGEHRVLFTGDTIFFSGGRWRAALLDGVCNRERHIESLRMIQALDFDLVVPGIAPAGQPAVSRVNRSEARQHIDGIIERLWQGFPG
jgi:glyoxylase-like metal-dependent hydrolase (beta-lactamase superfamily II)